MLQTFQSQEVDGSPVFDQKQTTEELEEEATLIVFKLIENIRRQLGDNLKLEKSWRNIKKCDNKSNEFLPSNIILNLHVFLSKIMFMYLILCV
jgi:hypothetical protein